MTVLNRSGSKGIRRLMRVWSVDQASKEFAEFYESARDDCLRIVLLNVGDRLLAEELVAEGFTRAWMSWRKVRDLQAPRAWIVRAALNVNVSRWRRHRREVALGSHDSAARPAAPVLPARRPPGPAQLLPSQTARRHRHPLPRAAHHQAGQPARHTHDQLRDCPRNGIPARSC